MDQHIHMNLFRQQAEQDLTFWRANEEKREREMEVAEYRYQLARDDAAEKAMESRILRDEAETEFDGSR